MSTWDKKSEYFSGQGVVLLSERDPVTGEPLGFVPVGNVSDLKITISTSNLEHKESQSGQRGVDLRLNTETNVGLSMTMENFESENLALVSRGKETKLETGSGTKKITVKKGFIYSLDHIKVSDVTITPTSGTALELGTDYELNEDAGSFSILTDSAIADDGVEVTVAYKYEDQFIVDALSVGSKELFMRFEGLNTVESNSPVIVEVFKFNTDPFNELALIGDDVQSFVLEGSVLSDPTRKKGSKYFSVKKQN